MQQSRLGVVTVTVHFVLHCVVSRKPALVTPEVNPVTCQPVFTTGDLAQRQVVFL